MKVLRSKWWTLIVAGVVLVLFGWLIVQNAIYAERDDTSILSTVLLDGVYSIDDGDWRPIDNTKPIHEHFHKAVFKGKFIEPVKYYHEMFISSKNVWYSLRYADGEEVITNHRVDISDLIPADQMMQQGRMLSTPGYSVLRLSLDYDEVFQEDREMILEVEDPYGLGTVDFSDCFYVTVAQTDGLYLRFFFDAFPTVLSFLLVCFFGVFFFPIASVILGRFDKKYIAFGALCFCSGFFLIMQRAGEYLNLWIRDATVCMMTDKLAGYFFVISVIYYLKSVMKKDITKAISNLIGILFVVLLFVATILHMTNTADLVTTSRIMNIMLIASAAVMTVLLCIDTKGTPKAELPGYLISWAPLVFFMLIDIVLLFIHVGDYLFIRIGLTITVIYQMIRFGLDLRKQYLEAIRYQQVQKELYEAKVSVMTSQIRPHFMYNALTSIAMMCTIDPKTAQQATITFAKYLRGNMDSLKQTAPVPFEIELEHLKKYLYIEKLRFDHLLTIEYDIRTTDFELPQLSIQPLVENAVKHGVGMKKGGGTVKLSTRETDDAYEVIIEDDGVGFDVNEKKDDGRSHVGMENTKKRLHDMCGGEVIINSKVGEGTTATVVLPKEGQHHEDPVS